MRYEELESWFMNRLSYVCSKAGLKWAILGHRGHEWTQVVRNSSNLALGLWPAALCFCRSLGAFGAIWAMGYGRGHSWPQGYQLGQIYKFIFWAYVDANDEEIAKIAWF